MKDPALNGLNGSWPAKYEVDLSDGKVDVRADGTVDTTDWNLEQ